ncbi:MAG: SURF1 family protein [Actinomycetia bacterium]|nr:SURF1 family protein [Actinomycetes bacterium]
MYEFAKRPLWILSHVLVIIAVLVMVRLGFWQFSRWQDETDARDRIEAGLEAAPQPLGDVVDPQTPPEEVDESARFARVNVTGEWDTDAEVVIRNRAVQGRPGGWLLTPLVQQDGTAVAVVRGWIPLADVNAGPPWRVAKPQGGEATVQGVVELSQPGGGLGPQDTAEGTLDTLARADLERYGQQLDYPLEPVWLVLQSSDPAQPAARGSEQLGLVAVEVELPSPSQNFSYMVQWWLFATIAAVGYLLILRKVARSKAGLDPDTVAPEDPPFVGGEDGGSSSPREPQDA